MSWINIYPTSDTKIRDLPDILSDNFEAIEDILDVEHDTLTSGTSGHHREGGIGIIFEGTTAAITALSSPPSGALAYDTTIGYLRKYTGSEWVVMTDSHPRVRAYKSTNSTAASASTQTSTGDYVVFDTEDYDELSEYDHSTGIFTASSSGLYHILVSVAVCASAPILTSNQPATAVADSTPKEWSEVPPQFSNLHWVRIDEYPTPDDEDYITTQGSGQQEMFTHSQSGLNPVPLNASAIQVSVKYRAKVDGCVCDMTCYEEEGCPCYVNCHQHECTCEDTCYEHSCDCYNTEYYGY